MTTTRFEPAVATQAVGAPGSVRVALGEYDIGWQDPDASLERAERLIADAASGGARLVVLPEMSTTGFTMDAAAWAEPRDGPSVRRLAAAARDHSVWIIAGLAARDSAGLPFNAAAVLDPDGAVRATYRKQRLFAYGGEHRSYVGGVEPVVIVIDGVRVSPFVCYDLRFPELFRRVARDVDAIVLIANWPAVRRSHWDTLVRARAIENQCYMVAVNRIGRGGTIDYDGGSTIIGPWGDVLATADGSADLDAAVVRSVRERYPFLDDMGPP